MKKTQGLGIALKTIEASITRGGVGVIPTDTLYGLVGSALRPKAVQRMYVLRKRDLKKTDDRPYRLFY